MIGNFQLKVQKMKVLLQFSNCRFDVVGLSEKYFQNFFRNQLDSIILDITKSIELIATLTQITTKENSVSYHIRKYLKAYRNLTKPIITSGSSPAKLNGIAEVHQSNTPHDVYGRNTGIQLG